RLVRGAAGLRGRQGAGRRGRDRAAGARPRADGDRSRDGEGGAGARADGTQSAAGGGSLRRRAFNRGRPEACATRCMRVAYYSPMPPSRSGIADYSTLLLPELSKRIDVVVAQARGRSGGLRPAALAATLPGRFRKDPPADV